MIARFQLGFSVSCYRLRQALGFAVLSATLITQAATAQEVPPLVRIVVPMAAGGPADFVARNMAEALKTETGSNVIIENKPGANGAIAASAVSRAKADGSTLLFATSGLLSITPHLDTGLQIDPGRDITPITPVVINGTALLVNPALGVSNIKEFVDYVKASDKPVALGSAGVGNILHLYIELLKDFDGAPEHHPCSLQGHIRRDDRCARRQHRWCFRRSSGGASADEVGRADGDWPRRRQP